MRLGTQSKNLGVGKVLNLSNTCINIVCINIICVCIYSLTKTLGVVHGYTPTCFLTVMKQVETWSCPYARENPCHIMSPCCVSPTIADGQENFKLISLISSTFSPAIEKNSLAKMVSLLTSIPCSWHNDLMVFFLSSSR